MNARLKFGSVFLKVIKFLLDMKRRGYNIQEVVNNKVSNIM